MEKKHAEERKPAKPKTPTFLLELPLEVQAGQAAHVGAHLEVGRQFYNAVLSAGQHRLRRMRADPAWQAARAIPRTHKAERRAAFAALRERYGFSEDAFHELAKALRVSWLAEHLDAVLAQTLATRAYRALNRVCLGKARRVRFKSRGRGLDSIENKRNDTGMRFVLEPGADGRPQGYLLWHDDRLAARIDWDDPVISHGLAHPIKYARLVRRMASGPRAKAANRQGERYCVQLVLTGVPHRKLKHTSGTDTIGLDLGPASIAIVPREAEARLEPLCAELRPDARAIRRLQRKMDRQRRAANPEHYDDKGRPKKRAKGTPGWKESRSYQANRRRRATRERKLAAHRKSLHGQLAHQIVAVGHTIVTEKLSYRSWQKRYGKSVGRCAPGMLIDHLKRTGAAHGRHPARSPHAFHQTLPILPRVWEGCQKAALAAAAPVPLRHWAGAARPVLGVSGSLSRSSRSQPLVCGSHVVPSRRCGGAPVGSTRASHPTRRVRGRSCPEAWASPVPERVCPKVRAKRHKSCFFSPAKGKWKRGSTARNPLCAEPGESSDQCKLSI
jgi:hypothetical protein